MPSRKCTVIQKRENTPLNKGSPQTLSGHLFLKNQKLKTVKQQKGKKKKGTS